MKLPKYKAWDKDLQSWIQIATLNFDEDGELWYMSPVMTDFNSVYYENELGESWYLAQSLGWNDDSDIELFGGDIARIWWSDQKGESHSELFLLSNPTEMKPEEMLFLANLDAIEKVGTIYENPEMVKVS